MQFGAYGMRVVACSDQGLPVEGDAKEADRDRIVARLRRLPIHAIGAVEHIGDPCAYAATPRIATKKASPPSVRSAPVASRASIVNSAVCIGAARSSPSPYTTHSTAFVSKGFSIRLAAGGDRLAVGSLGGSTTSSSTSISTRFFASRSALNLQRRELLPPRTAAPLPPSGA